jgi:hypothetical protein
MFYLGLSSCRIYFKFSLYFMGNMEIYKSCALQE